jgi:hypothetical protein
MPITQACIFTVENFLKILAKFIDFWGAESDNYRPLHHYEHFNEHALL